MLGIIHIQLAVEEFIKHEWCKGNVVGALLVDVKNAFPSVLHSHLLHNLRKRRTPEPLSSAHSSPTAAPPSDVLTTPQNHSNAQ
jgi:hypothetical protein